MAQSPNQVTSYTVTFTNNANVITLGGTVAYSGSNAPVTSAGGTFIPPTSDPHVTGAVWNNAGTLEISAG